MQSNEPGAIYELFEKENLPKLPFSISENGIIYVTEPLDREEKDSVSKHINFTDGRDHRRKIIIGVGVNMRQLNTKEEGWGRGK